MNILISLSLIAITYLFYLLLKRTKTTDPFWRNKLRNFFLGFSGILIIIAWLWWFQQPVEVIHDPDALPWFIDDDPEGGW